MNSPDHFHCLPIQEPWLLPNVIALKIKSGWLQSCERATRNGSAEELQETRDDDQAALLGYLKILDGCLTVLSWLRPEPGDDSLVRLAANRDLLQKHYDSLFPRWQNLEDLEAILLERISLSNAQLKEIAAKSVLINVVLALRVRCFLSPHAEREDYIKIE